MKYHYTYIITNKKNRIKYGGVHSCNCLPIKDIGIEYFGSSKYLTKKYQKKNITNFKYTVIELFDTRIKADVGEYKMLSENNAAGSELWYNKSNGCKSGKLNTLGSKHSDETKRKISVAGIGRKVSDETKKKMSTAKSNMSDETKKKLSIAKLNISDETKRKMSIAGIGRKHSDETKRKISITHALNINIYDNKDKLIFNCSYGFKLFCIMNNLPFESFKKSYQNSTKLLFNRIGGRSRAFIERYKQYDGWYAKVVTE